MADQQLDVALVLEAFKERVAQLEYDLVVATALLKQASKKLEELTQDSKTGNSDE